MKPEMKKVGRIVQSLKGRDKGRYFVVLKVSGENIVYIADGKTHLAENPKKKNLKHLRAQKDLVLELHEWIEREPTNINYYVKKALEDRSYFNVPDNKEE